MTDAGSTACPLADRECLPCRGGVPPLGGDALADYLDRLAGGWALDADGRLTKTFTFDDFRQALDFTNKVGELAESVGHHPDLVLKWGEVTVTVWTHKIGGLSETDFVFAAKVDQL